MRDETESWGVTIPGELGLWRREAPARRGRPEPEPKEGQRRLASQRRVREPGCSSVFRRFNDRLGRCDVGRWFEPPLRAVNEVPEMEIGEMQFGLAVSIEAKANALVGEGFADVIGPALVGKLPGGGNHLHLEIAWIEQRFVVLVEPAGAGLVEIRRELLIERLVRAVMIVAVLPALETALLGREVHRGGTIRSDR